MLNPKMTPVFLDQIMFLC